jgi:hypothetical protein
MEDVLLMLVNVSRRQVREMTMAAKKINYELKKKLAFTELPFIWLNNFAFVEGT